MLLDTFTWDDEARGLNIKVCETHDTAEVHSNYSELNTMDSNKNELLGDLDPRRQEYVTHVQP